MAKITAIEPLKKDPTRVSIYLDGQFAFDLAGIVAAWLKPGQELDQAKIASLQADDIRERAYQQSLDFLSYRTRSEAEIRQHLRKHMVAADVIEHTLDRLRSIRLADDSQFARAWVENRSTFRPRGRRALSWELKQKGIAAETAESALAGLDEDALAHEAGLKKAARLVDLEWDDFRTKLTGFLARRGFSYPVIAGAVSRLWDETHAGRHTADDNEDVQ
jgi:regulatory protein